MLTYINRENSDLSIAINKIILRIYSLSYCSILIRLVVDQ